MRLHGPTACGRRRGGSRLGALAGAAACLVALTAAPARGQEVFRGRTAVEWRAQLDSPRASDREVAIWALRSLGDAQPETGSALVALARADPEPHLRRAAFDAVADVASSVALAGSDRFLEDASPHVRARVAARLPQLARAAEPAVVASIASSLVVLGTYDEAPAVRLACVSALAEGFAPWSPALRDALASIAAVDSSGSVRRRAIEAVGRLCQAADDAWSILSATASDPDSRVRIAALEVAAARVAADSRYLELAAAALGDLRPRVVQIALEVLVAPRPPGELPAAITAELGRVLASSRVEPIRARACEALTRAGPDGVAALTALLATELWGRDQALLAELAGALASVGEQARPAVPLLIALCRRGYTWIVASGPSARRFVPPDRRRRLAAVRALGATGADGEEVIEALLSVLDDEHWPVRAAAADALGRVASPGPGVLEALERLERDPEAPVRHAGREALERCRARTGAR